MGLFEKIFKPASKKEQQSQPYFQTLTAYAPVWRTWDGQLYESELVRAAIDSRARHISKLRCAMTGPAKPGLAKRLNRRPNEWQTWSQWLYRLDTILDMQNTAFIVPVWDRGEITGYYPILPSRCEAVDVDGEIGLRYQFDTGKHALVMLDEVGIMTRYQYEDDLFGEPNTALNQTMALLDIQQQGVEDAVRNSASFRFIARLNNFKKDEDLAKEQQRFTRESLSGEGGGVLLFPNTYTDIQQIDSSPYTVDADEIELIQTNVYNYFGVNEKILQNSAQGDEMDAFFNGAIEPFEIQLSEVMTRLIYTDREAAQGSRFEVSANRLQYMSVDKKISMAQQLGDRGMLTINEVRELFNYPPLPEGDHAPIRGEYHFTDEEEEKEEEPAPEPPAQPDDIEPEEAENDENSTGQGD